jgi:hypothetical protein
VPAAATRTRSVQLSQWQRKVAGLVQSVETLNTLLLAGGLSYYELPSLWQLLTDTAEDAAIRTPLTLLLDQMEDSPVFRRGQVAGAIADLQAALEQVSHQVDGDDRLSLPVGTVVILAHVLVRHMP